MNMNVKDALPDAVENKESGVGVVVDGNLMAFAPGISRDIRDDVKDCLQLATIVANDRRDVEKQNAEWFNIYATKLEAMAWFPLKTGFVETTAGGSSLAMDKMILEMLGATLTASVSGAVATKMVAMAGDMIKKLSEAKDALKLFESARMSLDSASFRVGVCYQDDDGEIYIAINTVSLKMNRTMTSVLGFKWSSGEAQTYSAGRSYLFNPRQFKRGRATLEKELTAAANRTFEEFDF